MNTRFASACLCLWAGTTNIHAQSIRLNEVFADPPGTDNGSEFIELFGPPGQVLDGLSLVVIEGDTLDSGKIDKVVSLNGRQLGDNGLLLWRDGATVLLPGPDPLTATMTLDFSPDLENGGQTFVLAYDVTGVVGADLDVDNDGIFDSIPWGVTIDAVGYQRGPETGVDGYGNTFRDRVYGAYLGFADIDADVAFNAEALFRAQDTGDWYAVDFPTGVVNPGPYVLPPAGVIDAAGAIVDEAKFSIAMLTPGASNPVEVTVAEAVPEPGGYVAMVGLALVGVPVWWRRRARGRVRAA